MHHTLAASLVKWELRKIQNSIIITQTWKESCGIIFLDKTERRVFNEKGWLDLSFPQLCGRGPVETVLPKELPNYFCCPRPLPMWCMDKCFLHNGLLLASTLEQPSVKECLKAKRVACFFSFLSENFDDCVSVTEECTLFEAEPQRSDQTFALLARGCVH